MGYTSSTTVHGLVTLDVKRPGHGVLILEHSVKPVCIHEFLLYRFIDGLVLAIVVQ